MKWPKIFREVGSLQKPFENWMSSHCGYKLSRFSNIHTLVQRTLAMFQFSPNGIFDNAKLFQQPTFSAAETLAGKVEKKLSFRKVYCNFFHFSGLFRDEKFTNVLRLMKWHKSDNLEVCRKFGFLDEFWRNVFVFSQISWQPKEFSSTRLNFLAYEGHRYIFFLELRTKQRKTFGAKHFWWQFAEHGFLSRAFFEIL